MIPAHIEITTFQEDETSKILCDGAVSFENDSVFIDFAHTNSSTRIGISPGLITITKIGDESYTLILEEGKVKGTLINTGASNLELSILSEKTDIKKTDKMLDLYLKYTLMLLNNEIKTRVRIKCEFEQ